MGAELSLSDRKYCSVAEFLKIYSNSSQNLYKIEHRKQKILFDWIHNNYLRKLYIYI
jgi:hypothetical protein